jgi:hypothetical protein
MSTGSPYTRPGSVPNDHLGQEDDEVRGAIRFAVVAAVAGIGFLVLAAFWVSSCGVAADLDTVACGRPVRTALGLGGPVILFGSGVWAFLRTYRLWRVGGTWWGWQGAGWFLMMVMLLALTLGFIPIGGYGAG